MPTKSDITAAQVLAARKAAGLTQREAAELIGLRSAHRWSEYECGAVTMSLQSYRLFRLLTRQERLPDIRAR